MADETPASPPALDLSPAQQSALDSWLSSVSEDRSLVRLLEHGECYSAHGPSASDLFQALYPSLPFTPLVTFARSQLPRALHALLVSPLQLSVEHWSCLETEDSSGGPPQLRRRATPSDPSAFAPELARAPLSAPDVPGASPSLEPHARTAAVFVTRRRGQRVVGVAVVDAAARTLEAVDIPGDGAILSAARALRDLRCARLSLGCESGAAGEAELARLERFEEEESEGGGVDGPSTRAPPAAPSARVAAAPLKSFSARNLEQDLARLLRGGSAEPARALLQRPAAAQALAGALAAADALADAPALGRWRAGVLQRAAAMRVDAAALAALHVFGDEGGARDADAAALDAGGVRRSAGAFSLFALLDRTRTPQGRRLLRSWLAAPLRDLPELQARQGVVGLLLEDSELRGALRGLHLRGVPDVGTLKSKLERGKASLQDLCTLYRASARLPSLMSALEEGCGRAGTGGTAEVERGGAGAAPRETGAPDDSSPGLPSPASLLRQRFLAPLRACHAPEALVRYEELLEAAVDLDRIPDEYLIAASYDAALQSLQNRREELEEEIAEASAAAAEDLGLQLDKSLKMEWHRSANTRVRCLRITAKEERAVRGKLQKGYLELETRKDGIKFTNRRLKKAADALWALSAEYEGRQEDLVAQVVGVAATFVPLWEEVGSVLADLDVLAALAEVAASAPLPYCRPELLPPETGLLDFQALRHACVEVQDGVSYVPNDARLERGRSWFQVVTGPNMGGKSTHLRALGVAVLLAQIGSYVPAASARVALRDAVFTRVGAGDCQLRGVSTFMAEMLETAALLRAATADSLVIVDELGRGTSTWDGLGLAWAIAEHLMSSVQAATLFATHFHELTALEGPGGVANFHVDAAVDPTTGSVTMLYALQPGSCDESFGIHVAEYARFPPEIVAEAKRTAQAAGRASLAGQGEDEALDRGGRGMRSPDASALLKRKRQDVGLAMHAALLELGQLPLGDRAIAAAEAEAEGGLPPKEAVLAPGTRQKLEDWALRAEALLGESARCAV